MTVTQRIQLILRPGQAAYLYANQPRQDPVFAAVLAEKPIKQLCFDNMDNGFQDQEHRGNQCRWMPWANSWTWYLAGKRIWTAPLKDAQANGEKAMEEARNN